MTETFSLAPGVTLRCFRDPRFKQGCLSLYAVSPMSRQTAAGNALLPSVLLRGTKKSPDLRAVTARLDDLYGASLSPMTRRVGDRQGVGFYMGFVDDRFALPGDRVLEPAVNFLMELLLEPALEDGCFPRDWVEGEKRNLIDAIEAERNDKGIYAMSQLLKIMCREDPFGIPRLGEPEQVAAITPESLFDRYRTLLKTAPLELTYVGSAPGDTVASLLAPLAALPQRQVSPLPAPTGFHDGGVRHEVETMDVTQGKLCMGFLTPITLESPRYSAMQVLNVLYGSGMTSKLFRAVREARSLCYSISSGYYGSKGILTVSAGIDPEKEAVTREEILRQMEACRQGDITDEELQGAREALISGLRAVPDSPGAMESYYSAEALSGVPTTAEEAIAAIRAVTREQVAEAAATIRPHSTYFLKGAAE